MNAREKDFDPAASRYDLRERIAAVDWTEVGAGLDAQGAALIERLITPAECRALAALYPRDESFRSRVVMARHGFGRGEYKYFCYPLPGLIASLRGTLYPRLAPIANRWHEAMRIAVRFPDEHAEFIARCHAAGQQRPTPLLLQYGTDDFNCLHQDLYGEHVFPLQVVMLLSPHRGHRLSRCRLMMTDCRTCRRTTAHSDIAA